ncbi:DUF4407 domain-containing protein, partial [Dactylosporangium sp. NPDC005572]|uniref:DUF4407 domain-containing protein n=1 Tax=Dactylosporangium sp. NPDC005572 TaxID=3156889 RepID=UPI0033B36BEE
GGASRTAGAGRGAGAHGVRGLVYLLRVGMALAVALLMSEAIVLLIFQPEIRQVIAGQRQERYDAAAATAVAAREAAIDRQVAALHVQIEDRERDVTAADEAQQVAYQRYVDEVQGRISPQPGKGPKALAEYQTYLDRLADLRTARDRLDQTRGEVEPKVAALGTERAALRDPTSGPYRDLRDGDARWHAADLDRQGPAGWLEQERAFAQYRAAHRDDWSVQGIPWVLRGLFVAVDLVPLSLKLLGGWSVYGRRVREQGAAERYADRRKVVAQRADVDADVELAALRNGVHRRIDLEGLRRYLRTRAGHLERTEP